MDIAVIGLGKLGAPLAALLAAKGYRVTGVDVDPETVRAINARVAPVFEPGLSELLQQAAGKLTATEDVRQAVAKSDATFVIVPTPSDENGEFSLKFVHPALEGIGTALRDNDGFHLVVITSTVMPGAMGNEIRPALERHSGKRCGVDFGLCYNPEFIALGTVIKNMLEPDMVLIGESDKRSGDMLEDIHRVVCDNEPALARMNWINAELTKLAVNTFVTTKISYANMLAEVCEQLPGADVDTVTNALGVDTRIGKKYMRGATAFGGPCFPRDNVAFAVMARRLGGRAILAEATIEVNQRQVQRLADLVSARISRNGTVAILGLAYKPDTDVAENSPGVAVAQLLSEAGLQVRVYDPAALDNARRDLADTVEYADSMLSCIRGASAIVVTTPWAEFKLFDADVLADADTSPTVVDCWRILDRDRMTKVADYVVVGAGPPDETLSGEAGV